MCVKDIERSSLHHVLHAYIYRRSSGRVWGARRTTGLFRPRPGKGNTVRGHPPIRGIAYLRPTTFSGTTIITQITKSATLFALISKMFPNYPTQREASLRGFSRCIAGQRVKSWAIQGRVQPCKSSGQVRFCSPIIAQLRRQIVNWTLACLAWSN